MGYFTLIHPGCEKDIGTYGIADSLEKNLERLEQDGRHNWDRYGAYHCKLFKKHWIIAREIDVLGHRVLYCLKVLRAGDSEFEWLKDEKHRDQTAAKQLEPLIDHDELVKHVRSKTEKLDTRTPLTDEEREVLNNAFGGSTESYFENFVCESEDWVVRTTASSFEGNLRDVARTVLKILDKPDSTERRRRVDQRSDLDIVYRFFPEQRRLLLIAPIQPGDEKDFAELSRPEKYGRLLGPEGNTSIPVAEITQISARSYPDLMVCHEEIWCNIQRDKKANLALSFEEEEVLRRAQNVFSVERDFGYPLFINGRAGSGKSTILQYLFADYLYYWLKRGVETAGIPLPVYFSCSPSLITVATEAVGSLIICNASRHLSGDTIGERTALAKTIGPCFRHFHNFLLTLLPESERIGRFATERVDFGIFKQQWLQHFSRSPKGVPGPELSWHVIRSYIKGRKQDAYLDLEGFRKLPQNERTVTEQAFRTVYEIVWQKWYVDLTGDRGTRWDDQDITRRVLALNLAEPTFPAIFCDEAQDFTHLELSVIHKLSYYSNRRLLRQEQKQVPLAFAGDPFQTLNPTGFSWAAIQALYHNCLLEGRDERDQSSTTINCCELLSNYRSAEPIIRFCNLLQAVRQHLFALPPKELQPQAKCAASRLLRSSYPP